MSTRIKKAVLKAARSRLEPVIAESADRLDDLLMAAAVLGLSQQRYKWVQPPPPRTGLSWVEGSVMLAFRPKATLAVDREPTPDEVKAAESALTGVPEDRVESLQCLALKALEGNLEWTVPPQFPNLSR